MSQIHARTSKLQRSLAIAQASILMLGLVSMSLPATAFANNDDNDGHGHGGDIPGFNIPEFPEQPELPGFPNLPHFPDLNHISICHEPNGNHPQVLSVDWNALLGHLLHGDNFDILHCGTPTPPTPQSCSYVSDATTQIDTAAYAVTETPNPAWTTIPGASWIWGDVMTDAEAASGSTFTFVKTFALTGSTTAVVGVDLASDNGYVVSVNGHLIDDQSALAAAYSSTHHYDIPVADLLDGNNTLTITVNNLPAGNAATNPAGLTYKLSVTASTCGNGTPILPPPPAPAHLQIVKHVVNDGGGTKTAADFTLHVQTGSETLTDAVTPFPGSETGTTVDLPAGDYSINEDNAAHYAATFSQNCASGHIHLNPGDQVQCNVTNTYVPPPSCTIVSDASTQQAGQDSVALGFIHSAWTHLLDSTGAKWIWGEEPLADPTAAKTETFTKVVHVNGTPDSASIDFAADNGYQVRVNGTLVGGDHINDEHNYEATTTVNILSALTPNADNTIAITVQNLAMPGGTQQTNPAGLVYAIHINNSTCSVPDPHQTVTVHATKIVCDNESDLPNLQGAHHVTDANTAAGFLASHPSCHLQPDWQFEWGNQDAGNPGGSFIGHADGYTSSAATDSNGSVTMTVPVANMSSLHLREILKDGFIPFSDDNNNTVSAELSCGDDGLNYDNWEWINNPQAGQTYYCVAFNAPKTSTVKMCKTDDAQPAAPLSGWNLFLKGANVGSVSVKPDGTNYSIPNVPAGNYVITSTGQYVYRPSDTTASTSDAAYSLRLPSDSVYGGPYAPWVRENNFPSPYTGWLGIMMNSGFTDWGSVFHPDHTYVLGTTTAATGNLSFKILDDNYGDNSGSLAVSVDKGYTGITGEDGCVTFTNVPYGTYTAGELNQEGWTNVSGAGSVTVDQPTKTFTLVNHHITNGGGEPTHSEETIVVKAADLAQNISDVLADTSKWFFYNDNTDAINDSLGSFVTGPASAPAGTGSAQITLDATNNRTDIATYQFSGVKLANISTLQFSAYSHSGVAGASESPYLVFNVDFTGSNTWQKRLVYVPSANGSVPQDSWNTYDAINGGNALWTWSGFAGNGHKWPDNNTNEYRTWNDLKTAFPNIGVRATDSFMGVRVGEPGPATYTGNIDKFVIGVVTGSNTDTKTFDFEPTATNGGGETDLCSNIEGIQTSTDGYNVDGTECFPKEDTQTDLCSNIDGVQTTVPAGKVRRDDGTCVSSGGGTPQTFSWTSGGGGGDQGKVLGESTTTEPACSPLLTSFLKMGWKNDPDQVKKLQQFLADHLHITLPSTGFFGPMTHNAVKQFQKQEWDHVLKPWVGIPNSGITGQNTPTGFVYQTTKWHINNIVCEGSESFPDKLN